jgi:hypothetical protein
LQGDEKLTIVHFGHAIFQKLVIFQMKTLFRQLANSTAIQRSRLEVFQNKGQDEIVW